MITLLQQPGAIGLSRNQMILEFLASDVDGNPYRAYGVRSEINAAHNNGLLDGETLTLTWTEPDGTPGTLTFTAKNNPTTSLHIPTQASFLPKSVTGIDYWEEVAAVIAAHPTVDRHFSVYARENAALDFSLWIETVDIDNDWVLTLTKSVTTYVFTITNFTTSLSSSAPDNYAVFVDVFFEETYESGEFHRLAQLELPIDSAGAAQIDLSELITAAMDDSLPDVPVSVVTGSQIRIADNLRNYYFRYREDYDGVSPSWTVSDTKKAMAGGVTQEIFATMDFLGTRSGANSLLTWYPSGKSIGPDQPEWISWYNYNESNKSILIEVKAWTADSVTPTVSYHHSIVDPVVGMWETAMIPVGPDLLSLADDVKKYTVQVIDYADYSGSGTITPLSETRSFYIDRLPHREVRYLLYENGFRLPEILRCVGNSNDQLTIDRQERSHVLPAGYTRRAPEISQYKEDYTNRHTFRTGYIGRTEVDALQELLIYNRAFEIETGGYVPLHLEGNRYQVYNTSEFLNGVEFVAIRKLRDKIYSRRDRPGGYVAIPEAPAISFDCDFTIEGAYDNFSAAVSAGVTADQYFSLTAGNDFALPEGLIIQYSPSYSFSSDSTAGIVPDDSCYALSSGNDYGYPVGLVKRKNPGTTYANDTAAAAGGVSIGERYALAYPNDYEIGDEGFMKIRIS